MVGFVFFFFFFFFGDKQRRQYHAGVAGVAGVAVSIIIFRGVVCFASYSSYYLDRWMDSAYYLTLPTY